MDVWVRELEEREKLARVEAAVLALLFATKPSSNEAWSGPLPKADSQHDQVPTKFQPVPQSVSGYSHCNCVCHLGATGELNCRACYTARNSFARCKTPPVSWPWIWDHWRCPLQASFSSSSLNPPKHQDIATSSDCDRIKSITFIVSISLVGEEKNI